MTQTIFILYAMVLLISIFEMLSSYNSIVAKSSPTVPLHQLLF